MFPRGVPGSVHRLSSLGGAGAWFPVSHVTEQWEGAGKVYGNSCSAGTAASS